MIKDNQVHLNRAHVIVDGLIIAGSYIASYPILMYLKADDKVGYIRFQTYLMALYYVLPAYLLLYYILP